MRHSKALLVILLLTGSAPSLRAEPFFLPDADRDGAALKNCSGSCLVWQEDTVCPSWRGQHLFFSEISGKIRPSYFGGRENKKLVAVLLAVALGPFGVHRLYLGTDPKVPVIYTLTLGGGLGVLPFADIIAILSAKDISVYENNPHVIMWVE